MATIEYELVINAKPEIVYEISQSYSAIRYLWDPFPKQLKLLDGATSIAKGVKVFILAKNGFKMVVEFVQVTPPSAAAIKMIKGPFFLQSFAGSWTFKPIENTATKAKFTYSIKAKKWALPFITNAIINWYFSYEIRRRLEGLKSYCENNAV